MYSVQHSSSWTILHTAICNSTILHRHGYTTPGKLFTKFRLIYKWLWVLDLLLSWFVLPTPNAFKVRSITSRDTFGRHTHVSVLYQTPMLVLFYPILYFWSGINTINSLSQAHSFFFFSGCSISSPTFTS